MYDNEWRKVLYLEQSKEMLDSFFHEELPDEHMEVQPEKKVVIKWAKVRRIKAASPSLNAAWLGSMHSNINTFTCLLCPKTKQEGEKIKTISECVN